MFKGRSSANLFPEMHVNVIMILLLLVLHSYQLQVAEAAKYPVAVGGANGWTFNTIDWPSGKHFVAGDTLEFKYNPTYHNVVKVDSGGYKYCTTPKGAKVYKSGSDEIKLVKGQNFFICSIPGHCQSGMKIAVFAA